MHLCGFVCIMSYIQYSNFTDFKQRKKDHISYVGNQARYSFIELDMSTGPMNNRPRENLPRTQACSRYPSDQRRLGTERDSEFSRQAWQVTSHPKSPRTTGNEAAGKHIHLCRYRARSIELCELKDDSHFSGGGGQCKNAIELDDFSSSVTYRARFLISREKKEEKKWKLNE